MQLRFFIFLLTLLCSTGISGKVVTDNDSLLKKIEDAVTSSEKIKLYNQLSKLYWYSNPSRTLEYGKNALELALETDNDTLIINSRINIGIGYLNLASYDKAMEQFILSLTLAEQVNYKEGMANSYSNIAVIYDYLRNYKKSEENYLKALKINKERNYTLGVIGTLNNLGILYTKTTDYDKALDCYEEALDIEKENDQKQMLAITLSNIGGVYEYNGENGKAIEYYRSSLNTGKELDSKTLIISSLINIGLMNVKFDRTDSALYYYNEAATLSVDAGFRNFLKDIYLYTSEVYDKKNDPENAFIYYKKYATLKDSLLSEESNNKITELQVKYETEAKQKENDILQKENRYQKNLRNIFIALSVLVILLAILIFRNYKNKKKSNILLLEKNIIITKQKEQQEMIHRQQQEITTLEIQKKEKENMLLKNDLEFKNKELASKAMYIIQNNELVDSVIHKLRQLEKKTEEKERISQIEIRSLINDLRTSVRHDSWKEFETHFTQVHQDFYTNLHNKFPDLTANEKKLCAFLRLNLSTKEISEITSKSVHSINVARTRLRQKLGITGSDDNLTAFMSKF